MLTARVVAALTDLIRELRPDWHRAGIRAAIRGGDYGAHTAHDIAATLIRRAADPNNRTPQLQPADFRPPPEARCPAGAGAWPHGRCAGCCVADSTLLDPTERPIEPFVVVAPVTPIWSEATPPGSRPMLQWHTP